MLSRGFVDRYMLLVLCSFGEGFSEEPMASEKAYAKTTVMSLQSYQMEPRRSAHLARSSG